MLQESSEIRAGKLPDTVGIPGNPIVWLVSRGVLEAHKETVTGKSISSPSDEHSRILLREEFVALCRV